MDKDPKTRLRQSGLFSHLDLYFARFITGLANVDANGGNNGELFLAAALVSRYKAEGHICLDLNLAGGSLLFTEADTGEPFFCPETGKWRSRLEHTSVVGKPGQYRPLILDDQSRLYLYRYWDYQEKLAQYLIPRMKEPDGCTGDYALPSDGLIRLFPPSSEFDTDWQKQAAITALTRRFCVISGGPGTGKTTTVAKIIALCLEQSGQKILRIALAAPTGKAASRLQDAVKTASEQLDCPEPIKEKIPIQASTIHRLLGSIPDSPHFQHNAQYPLPLDMLIVDEASMVDMALMAKLVQALPESSRLILLGDKDQLASVEAGAVLADICDSGDNSEAWEKNAHLTHPHCIVELRKNFRFESESGIGAVSRAVNAGDGNLALTLLKAEQFEDIHWNSTPQPQVLASQIRDRILSGFKDYLQTIDPHDAFELFDRFRILCAIKEGPYGVSALNRISEHVLGNAGLIDPEQTWYRGRPVLITRNDYHLGLFNGDVGIVLPDLQAGNHLRVFFPAPDNTFKRFHPLRLPAHETVYAMTVHRSQGSEFDQVILLLPEKDYTILTRELIYTGITRAKKRIAVWGRDTVFRSAVGRSTQRVSGLRDALLRSWSMMRS